MSKPLIQNRDRWLAVSLLIVVIGLFYVVAVMPVLAIADNYQESIDDLEFRLERDKRLALQKDSVLKQVKEIKKQQASSNNFISRESTALASADLQKKVKSTITEAGGDLTSTQVIPGREEERFVRIGIKVRMSGNVEVLKSVLYELEAATPMLMIDSLNIRSVKRRRNRKTRRLEPSDKLNINFEVIGYMRI